MKIMKKEMFLIAVICMAAVLFATTAIAFDAITSGEFGKVDGDMGISGGTTFINKGFVSSADFGATAANSIKPVWYNSRPMVMTSTSLYDAHKGGYIPTTDMVMFTPMSASWQKSTGHEVATTQVKMSYNLVGESVFVGGGPQITLPNGNVIQTGVYVDGKTNIPINNIAVQRVDYINQELASAAKGHGQPVPGWYAAGEKPAQAVYGVTRMGADMGTAVAYMSQPGEYFSVNFPSGMFIRPGDLIYGNENDFIYGVGAKKSYQNHMILPDKRQGAYMVRVTRKGDLDPELGRKVSITSRAAKEVLSRRFDGGISLLQYEKIKNKRDEVNSELSKINASKSSGFLGFLKGAQALLLGRTGSSNARKSRELQRELADLDSILKDHYDPDMAQAKVAQIASQFAQSYSNNNQVSAAEKAIAETVVTAAQEGKWQQVSDSLGALQDARYERIEKGLSEIEKALDNIEAGVAASKRSQSPETARMLDEIMKRAEGKEIKPVDPTTAIIPVVKTEEPVAEVKPVDLVLSAKPPAAVNIQESEFDTLQKDIMKAIAAEDVDTATELTNKLENLLMNKMNKIEGDMGNVNKKMKDIAAPVAPKPAAASLVANPLVPLADPKGVNSGKTIDGVKIGSTVISNEVAKEIGLDKLEEQPKIDFQNEVEVRKVILSEVTQIGQNYAEFKPMADNIIVKINNNAPMSEVLPMFDKLGEAFTKSVESKLFKK